MSATVELKGDVVRPSAVVQHRVLPVGGVVSGNYPFTAICHHEWEFEQSPHVHAHGEWLPKINEARHVPGGNGTRVVGTGKDARMDVTGMLAGIERKLSVRINLHDPRLGEYSAYLAKFPLSDGRVFYCYSWVSMVIVNRGRNVVPKPNPAAMVGFRRKVFEAGIVDPMPRQTLDTELQIVQNRISRWNDMLAHGELVPDAHRKQVGEAQDLMEDMIAAWERQFGELEAAQGVEAAGQSIDQGSEAPDPIPGMEIEITPSAEHVAHTTPPPADPVTTGSAKKGK